MAWTEDRVEKLKKLWADGLSASVIATALGEVTRNAVIGKVHRLGLSGRAKSSAPKSRKPRSTTRQLSQPRGSTNRRPIAGGLASSGKSEGDAFVEIRPILRPYLVEEIHIPVEQRKSILELNENTCKWPIGDPTHEEFYFCGADSLTEKPYCAHHAGVAYQVSSDRRYAKRSRNNVA